MRLPTTAVAAAAVLFTLAAGATATPAPRVTMMVRLSEIEVVPEYLAEYLAILKTESAASMRLEPGVIALFPMAQQDQPTQIRILEIYADRAAYESHLQSPHFQTYKTSTLKMVKALRLLDMRAIDADGMAGLFKKLP